MSTDLKLSKAQISKIIQSGGFLGLQLLLQQLTKEFKVKYMVLEQQI